MGNSNILAIGADGTITELGDPELGEFAGLGDSPLTEGAMSDKAMEGILAMLLGGPPAWKDGDNLPHLVYTDPPGGMTAEAYELALKDTAREAVKTFTADGEAQKQFTAALTYGLGEDLVVAHGVPVDKAIAAVIEFAGKVWAEVYPPVANTAEPVTP